MLGTAMKVVTWHHWFGTSRVALMTISINAIALLLSPATVAQLTPDQTLGAEQSTLRNTGTLELIEGGARRGSNLFHSFEQFNINNGQSLYFANPDGVTHIISRVTGRNPSSIQGTLGVQGSAHLFLLNPNGISFGQGAKLDIKGSFVATTANQVQFGNQGFFSANDPQAPPLLTVNPSALLFTQLSPGKIQTQSSADAGQTLLGAPLSGLRVANGQNLLFVGGDVGIQGGVHALGGKLEVAAVATPAIVELNAEQRPSVQRISEPSDRANVLIDRALVKVEAGGNGSIQVIAKDIKIQGQSRLRAGIESGLGTPESRAGDIVLNATGAVEVSGGSTIWNRLYLGSRGVSGDLIIRARSLLLNQESDFRVSTSGQGNAGRVILQAEDAISLVENTTIFNTVVFTEPKAIGSTGGIFIEAGSLKMLDGAELILNTSGIGNVGDSVLQVRGDVTFAGTNEQGDPSGIFNVVRPPGIGNAGEIRLSAGSLSITDGARLQANTRGRGNAGNIKIQVRDRLFLDSEDYTQDLTGIYSTVAAGEGQGGDIDIQAGSFLALNGAQVTANTFSIGDSGNITIQVRDQAIFDGSNVGISLPVDRTRVVLSGVFSGVGEGFTDGTIPAFGNGGNIRLSAKGIELRNGASFGAGIVSGSQGNAGSITLIATERMIIDGQNQNRDTSGVFTTINPGAIGNANDIQITTDHLTLSNGGSLVASIGGDGTAGNIRINSRILEVFSGGQMRTITSGFSSAGNIVLESDRIHLSGQNSGLFANAEASATGRGGDINVNTRRLNVADQAQLTVSSPRGQAGNLNIFANAVVLNRGKLTAETGRGSGAEINLQRIESLLLRNSSLISAQAFGTATGGNITIDAKNGVVVAVPNQNNDIIAIASQGRGGNISITTQGIFGIEQRFAIPGNQSNDIDASSQFSQSGTVTINRPDVDPTQGIAELPSEPRPQQPLASCQPGRSGGGRFIATGTGGLPTHPDEPLSNLGSLDDLDLPVQYRAETTTQPATIEEAQGWILNSKGEVMLVGRQSLASLPCSSDRSSN
jgi:filamentous hemagglutinin family protein